MQRPSPLKLSRLSLPPESVMKSPTLSRVHRMTMKLEEPHLFIYSTDDEDEEQPTDVTISEPQADLPGDNKLLKGPLLTVARGTFFKKWKVRYFMLTKDFLSCFKLTKNGPSTMGDFVYKIRLAEVKNVEWVNSRSDALGTITLLLGPVLLSPVDDLSAPNFDPSIRDVAQQGRAPIMLRAPIGVKDATLYDWFESIEENVEASKMRRAARSASFGGKDAVKMPVSPLVRGATSKSTKH